MAPTKSLKRKLEFDGAFEDDANHVALRRRVATKGPSEQSAQAVDQTDRRRRTGRLAEGIVLQTHLCNGN